MWNKPWKYREGFAISIGLLITGALLQVSIGAMEWLVFMWPANIIALTALVIVSGLFYALRSKVYLFRFMTQVEAAVPALATASVLTVIMGLSRQVVLMDTRLWILSGSAACLVSGRSFSSISGAL